jgi:hypothetical protein
MMRFFSFEDNLFIIIFWEIFATTIPGNLLAGDVHKLLI